MLLKRQKNKINRCFVANNNIFNVTLMLVKIRG